MYMTHLAVVFVKRQERKGKCIDSTDRELNWSLYVGPDSCKKRNACLAANVPKKIVEDNNAAAKPIQF